MEWMWRRCLDEEASWQYNQFSTRIGQQVLHAINCCYYVKNCKFLYCLSRFMSRAFDNVGILTISKDYIRHFLLCTDQSKLPRLNVIASTGCISNQCLVTLTFIALFSVSKSSIKQNLNVSFVNTDDIYTILHVYVQWRSQGRGIWVRVPARRSWKLAFVSGAGGLPSTPPYLYPP